MWAPVLYAAVLWLAALPLAVDGAFTCCTAANLGQSACSAYVSSYPTLAGNDPGDCAALGDLFASAGGAYWSSTDPVGLARWSAAAAGTPTDFSNIAGVASDGVRVLGITMMN